MFRRISKLVPALLVPTAALALAACTVSVGGGPDAGMPELAPKDSNAAIKAVKLGTSDTNEFDHSRTGTSFPAGTKKVGVWYRWEGAENGTRIDIRWSTRGEVVLEQDETLQSSSGQSAWFLFLESGNAIPNGRYQVELLEDGNVVSTATFTVGS